MVEVAEKKFTAREAAEALGVTEACIRRWILTKRIACVKIGKRLVRIPESELRRILHEGYSPARNAQRE